MQTTAKVNFARIGCITIRIPARRVTPPWTFTWQNLTPAERATRSGRPGYPPWRSPHLSCKRDQIKIRDPMERRFTPPKRVTSPTWGPPTPCKQALEPRANAHNIVGWLNVTFCVRLHNLLHVVSVCTYLKEGNGERYNEHEERKKEKW